VINKLYMYCFETFRASDRDREVLNHSNAYNRVHTAWSTDFLAHGHHSCSSI
jgi:hypothetical protein